MATRRDANGAPGPAVHRVADVLLRGSRGPLRARAYWPEPGPSAPLLVFFPAVASVARGDGLCRGLCSGAGVVVLSVPYRSAPDTPNAAAFHDVTTATEWAADHAAELDADPGRLLVGGEGAGGALAAAVAIHARDQGWPELSRQVLIRPDFDVCPPHSPSLARVAPATVVTASTDPRRVDGHRYAARLRNAGVEVDAQSDRTIADLADTLRVALK